MRVKVNNFQAIEEAEIEVEGFTCVLGPTHAGKSSLMRAVDAAFYNNPPKGALRDGAKYMQVEIDLEGKNWVWVKSNSSVLYVDGQKYDKIGRGYPAELLQLVGMDPVIVDKKQFKPNFQRQLKDLYGVGETPATMFNLLLSFSSYDKIPDIKRQAEQDQKDSKNVRLKKEGLFEGYKQEVETLEGSINTLQERRNKILRFLSLVNNLKNTLSYKEMIRKHEKITYYLSHLKRIEKETPQQIEDLKKRIRQFILYQRTIVFQESYSKLANLEEMKEQFKRVKEFLPEYEEKKELQRVRRDLIKSREINQQKYEEVKFLTAKFKNVHKIKDKITELETRQVTQQEKRNIMTKRDNVNINLKVIQEISERFKKLEDIREDLKTLEQRRGLNEKRKKIILSVLKSEEDRTKVIKEIRDTTKIVDVLKDKLSVFVQCPECGAPVTEGKYQGD